MLFHCINTSAELDNILQKTIERLQSREVYQEVIALDHLPLGQTALGKKSWRHDKTSIRSINDIFIEPELTGI